MAARSMLTAADVGISLTNRVLAVQLNEQFTDRFPNGSKAEVCWVAQTPGGGRWTVVVQPNDRGPKGHLIRNHDGTQGNRQLQFARNTISGLGHFLASAEANGLNTIMLHPVEFQEVFGDGSLLLFIDPAALKQGKRYAKTGHNPPSIPGHYSKPNKGLGRTGGAMRDLPVGAVSGGQRKPIEPPPAIRVEPRPVHDPRPSPPIPAISLRQAVATINHWRDINGDDMTMEIDAKGCLRVMVAYGPDKEE